MRQKTLQQFNLLLVGPGKTGKTSITKQFIYQEFDSGYQPTKGVNFRSHTICSKGNKVKVILWDTSSAKSCRSLISMHLHNKNLNAVGLVLDGSIPLEEAVIFDWLAFVLEQSTSVPIFFLFNKVDVIPKSYRTQQKTLWFQKMQTLLAQKILGNRKVSIHFCSAKTGEGIQKIANALFVNPNETKKKIVKNEVKQTLLDRDSILSELKPPQRVCKSHFLHSFDSKESKTAPKLWESQCWIGGNLVIFLLTIALFAALFFAAGSLSLIGILPAWGMCLMVGGLVLFGWNIGYLLYHRHSASSQMIEDQAEMQQIPENITIAASQEKEEDLSFQLTPFWSAPTIADSIPPSQYPKTPTHTVCQNSLNLKS